MSHAAVRKHWCTLAHLNAVLTKTLDSLDVQMHVQPNKLSSSLKDACESSYELNG